nr:reverse transcriptase domain-containing protein [Tanacetum cinerariifolium]
MQNQLTNLTDLITKFVNSNSASTSSSGITTRSGVSYDGPQIPPPPSFLPKVVENEPEATKDTVHPTNNGSTEDVQPLLVQSELTSKPVTSPISEPVIDPVSASKPNSKSSIPYPSRRNDERNREKANNQIRKFYQIFKDMSFEVSLADALILMPKFASTLKALIENKEKLSEMARTPLNEHFSAVLLKKLPKKLGDPGKFLIPCDFPGMTECLALADLGASINLLPFSMWKRLSLPDLTPICMTLDLADRSISRPVGVAEDVYVKVGSFHFLADLGVVDFDADPRVPLILGRSFLKTRRALIYVFKGELTLCVGKEAITFNLDQTSRYSANYSDMTAKRIDVIDMACEEYSQKVLGFSDTILSGNPTPYYDPIVSTTSPTLTPILSALSRPLGGHTSKGRNRRRSKQRIEEFNLEELSPPIVTMVDQRTMAQLLQAPIKGYEDAIVVLAITADNFELKHGLLTLVQNKQFFGHDKDDPHAHVRYFNKITSTLKFPNVSNTSIKLMLFLFSLEGATWIWLEKDFPRSIFTWDDLVLKFINQFFPPSKTTNLRNEITNFQQRFDESFSEAWDRFKDLLRACPHHGFLELHQLDTFYNALNLKYQDSLNSAIGGNFLDKMPRECLAIIESKSKVRYSRNKPVVAKGSTNPSTSGISPDVAELKDIVKALLLDIKSQNQSPAPVKAV